MKVKLYTKSYSSATRKMTEIETSIEENPVFESTRNTCPYKHLVCEPSWFNRKRAKKLRLFHRSSNQESRALSKTGTYLPA